nr:hypothetical protein [Elusimicrobiota bacterium]
MKSVFTAITILFLSGVTAAGASFKGEASLQTAVDCGSSPDTDINLRYIPQFEDNIFNGTDIYLSAELGMSGSSLKELSDNVDADFYRFWLRYQKINWEVRVGLQKINFGPAKIFRSLMWFESADTRDPLKIAKGIKGILGRYYFLNNSNIWIWG